MSDPSVNAKPAQEREWHNSDCGPGFSGGYPHWHPVPSVRDEPLDSNTLPFILPFTLWRCHRLIVELYQETQRLQKALSQLENKT